MIVTGEASGDLHGSNLVRALRSKRDDLEFCGMGGSELESLGVEILFDAAKISVVGITEVLFHLKDIFQAQSTLKKSLVEDPPDLLIVIDLPDFNLILAKKAKKLGIPVFYYIAPQIWAWRSGRVHTIKKRVDKVGVILPFEEQFFKKHDVDAKYVGHPLLDTVETTSTKNEFFTRHGIDKNSQCIGLLPGSRKQEVASLLPIFLDAALQLQENRDESAPLVFLIPQASTISLEEFDNAGIGKYADQLDIKIIADDRYNLMSVCDAVVAASGTVTLELAILEIPMVVVYTLAKSTYFIAKLLVKLDHFSLVNLIAGKTVVPELLQDEVTPENISRELRHFISAGDGKNKIQAALAEVRAKLGEKGASQRAADVALSLLPEKC